MRRRSEHTRGPRYGGGSSRSGVFYTTQMSPGGRGIDRRAFLRQCAAGALASIAPANRAESAGAPRELLYNGIRLPSEWPPRQQLLPTTPVTPFYLTDPPDVISIDTGRQLF